MFLGLPCFLGFCIGLKHGLHEVHIFIVPKLVVGLLRIRGLTCSCTKGLTILVIAMVVTSIMRLVGAAMGFAALAKLLTACLVRDSITQAPRCFPLGITLGIRTGCGSLTFSLELLVVLLNHDLLNIL